VSVNREDTTIEVNGQIIQFKTIVIKLYLQESDSEITSEVTPEAI
jgi:hypothetical protein